MDQYYPPGPGTPLPGQRSGNGFAIASMVLGILSVILFCYPMIAVPSAILAIIFGMVGRRRSQWGASGGGMATVGLLCGLFNISVFLLGFGLFCAGVTLFGVSTMFAP